MPTLNKVQLIAWVFFLLLLLLTCTLLYYTIYIPDVPAGKDFIAFWSAAKLSTLGRPELAYDLNAMKELIQSASTLEKSFVWLYPPTYQAILYKIGLISYKSAFLIFVSTTTLAFIASLLILSKKEHRIIMTSAPTIFIAIAFGQNSLITAALGLISIRLMRSHPILSGISMGLLSIKPHLFICLPLFALIEKKWKVLAWTITTGASLVIYSIILLGTKPWISFFDNIKKSSIWLQDATFPLDLMTSVAASAMLYGISPTVSYTMHILNLTLLLLITILIFKKTKDINLRGCMVILVTINLSPYFYVYELTWLTVALAFMLKSRAWSAREYLLIGVSWLLPLADFGANNIFEKSFSGVFIASQALALTILLHLTAKANDQFILSVIHPETNRIQK